MPPTPGVGWVVGWSWVDGGWVGRAGDTFDNRRALGPSKIGPRGDKETCRGDKGRDQNRFALFRTRTVSFCTLPPRRQSTRIELFGAVSFAPSGLKLLIIFFTPGGLILSPRGDKETRRATKYRNRIVSDCFVCTLWLKIII